MKTSFLKSLTLALATAGAASAAPINFIYDGSNYGVLDITYQSATSIRVQFTAAGSVTGLTNYQVTGFGFAFGEGILPSGISVSNPADGQSATDNDGLDWVTLTNLKSIPNATNDITIKKAQFFFGVTEGNSGNINVPGVLPGTTDAFFLNGFTGLTAESDLDSSIILTGIRVQGIKYAAGYSGEGSLFLAGTPTIVPPVAAVPEPSTVALMGLGLLGMAAAARRRKK